MNVEKRAEGWYVEWDNRFYNITVKWCDEMRRHQGSSPPLNTLHHLMRQETATAEDVRRLLPNIYSQLGQSRSRTATNDPGLHEWIKEQRANR